MLVGTVSRTRSARNTLRALLLVVGFLSLGAAGYLYLAQDAGVSGPAAVAGVASVAAFLVALLVSLRRGPARAPAAAPPPKPELPYVPHPEVVDIKRTEMRWRSSKGDELPRGVQARLEELEREMQSLKVRLGLGQISTESYKRMMADLREQKVKLELSAHRSGGPKTRSGKS